MLSSRDELPELGLDRIVRLISIGSPFRLYEDDAMTAMRVD
jgi:hypothetical protein